MNGYDYADNSPVSMTDPTGLRTCNGTEDCQGDLTHGNPAYDPDAAKRDEDERQRRRNEVAAPPACKNHGAQINCALTDQELELIKELEVMKTKARDNCGLFCALYHLRGRANPDEMAWCWTVGPSECLTAMSAAGQAKAAANQEYPGGENSKDPDVQRKWNAFHHAYWFGMMAMSGDVSKKDAMLLGMAHEHGAYLQRIHDGDTKNPNIDVGEQDSRADMFNNEAGYNAGHIVSENSGHEAYAELRERIRARVESGELAMYGS
jgi:hypothetical protein